MRLSNNWQDLIPNWYPAGDEKSPCKWMVSWDIKYLVAEYKPEAPFKYYKRKELTEKQKGVLTRAGAPLPQDGVLMDTGEERSVQFFLYRIDSSGEKVRNVKINNPDGMGTYFQSFEDCEKHLIERLGWKP
jgi:hypothetical protein